MFENTIRRLFYRIKVLLWIVVPIFVAGEDLYIALRGTSQDVAVRLEKSSVQLDATFISLGSQKTVTISNRSDIVAHFRWTRFATANEESQQKLTLVNQIRYEIDYVSCTEL